MSSTKAYKFFFQHTEFAPMRYRARLIYQRTFSKPLRATADVKNADRYANMKAQELTFARCKIAIKLSFG